MSDIIVGSHNVLFTMDERRWKADLKKSSIAHVVGYQEAENDRVRKVLTQHCEETGRGLFHPDKTGNPISWSEKEYFNLGVQGVVDSHLGAVQMGVKAKFNPPRDYSFVGLEHKVSRQKHLFIDVHPVAGGTKLESNPDNHDSEQLTLWKDWAIGQYWLDIMSFVAKEMSNNASPRKTDPFWDAIIMMGDFNAYLDRKERWYYPGALLPALFTADQQVRGLDHIVSTHGSDIAWTKRWSVDGHTDHRIHFRKGTIKEVADFPRQK